MQYGMEMLMTTGSEMEPEIDERTELQEAVLHLGSTSAVEFFQSHSSQHIQNIRAYFGPFESRARSQSGIRRIGWSGKFFEEHSKRGQRDRFDGNDLAAIACLSIPVGPDLVGSITTSGDVLSEALRAMIDLDWSTKIWEVEEAVLGPTSALHQLWDNLVRIDGIGETIASKLLASKFPHLLPVIDSRIRSLVQAPDGYWIGWHRTMTPGFRDVLENLRADAGLSDDVSLLRIADVSLWMWERNPDE